MGGFWAGSDRGGSGGGGPARPGGGADIFTSERGVGKEEESGFVGVASSFALQQY